MVVSTFVSQQSQRRKRGVILSSQGWQKLQAAEQLAAMQDNASKPYTLDQLSDRTGLSVNTLTKVRRRQKPVDQPTLDSYFEAFGLSLTADDYIGQDSSPTTTVLNRIQKVPLQGQLVIDSPFYIYRPPAEQICHEEVMHPGALIRVKAPCQYGKTSLMARILTQARERECRTAVVSLQFADREIFSSISRFLQWFCAVTTQALQMPITLDQHWSELFGNNYNASRYFETYLLPTEKTPLVLAIDDADLIFAYPEIASDFFGMLRGWYERAKHGVASSDVWQQLRLVIVHSNEVYLPLNLNQSPFNVGLQVELPGFTQSQVQELVQRYGLHSSDMYADYLIDFLAGNPYLTQLALFALSQCHITLEQLESQAIAPNGIFSSHLRRLLGNLHDFPELLDAMQQVIKSPNGANLSPIEGFKLQGMGLIRFQEHQAIASCRLYQDYFSHTLK
ncbi:MAG TPA: AAA-like domain-containing protein [Leptolyngbyaceae cyanobacterium M33_DOE_097]|uniref:Serine/threonine protein kinase n=1 Tax=Oscillatoriales cyanobacterium SpSt-418 TaxID=2282169 RepID=A0A7C3KIB1_9CYAN|nr:AAA-like domain-containing protein [Leptolyngbyaceae cyanobacterium M33_DOE_097]